MVTANDRNNIVQGMKKQAKDMFTRWSVEFNEFMNQVNSDLSRLEKADVKARLFRMPLTTKAKRKLIKEYIDHRWTKEEAIIQVDEDIENESPPNFDLPHTVADFIEDYTP